MKIHKVLSLAIIANISIIGGAVSIGQAQADDGELQTVFIEVDLGPQDNALVLEISGEELDPFEVSCHDDGQLPDRVRNDTIQTCQGEVPSQIELTMSLRLGGGEMTALVAASSGESAGEQRYLVWNDSGLHQVSAPNDIAPPSQGQGEVEAPLQTQPQPPEKSTPLLPFVLGAVAGLGLAVILKNLSVRDVISSESNIVGLPPDIEECAEGVDFEATINDLLDRGPLVIAHPESFVLEPNDRANIISVTERDVVDVIDVLTKLARELPTKRIGLLVLGELESIGDPGLSFVERLEVEAPIGSVIRVLK